MDNLSQLLSTFNVHANIIHNGQYCGDWAVDISGPSFISFHLVTQGQCNMRVNCEEPASPEQDLVLQEGDLVLFPTDAKHCLTNKEDFSFPVNVSQSVPQSPRQAKGTGLVCGYFEYTHPLIRTLCHQLPDVLLIRATDSHANTVHKLMQIMMNEAMHMAPGSDVVLNRLADGLLTLVLRQYLPEQSGILNAMNDKQLSVVMSAIQTRPDKKWTVESMAGIVHMSRAKFAELFKITVGLAPLEYLTQWRISLAQNLLTNPQNSTLNVALQCGYDNESSFSKAFKRVSGVSPGAIRAEGRAQKSRP